MAPGITTRPVDLAVGPAEIFARFAHDTCAAFLDAGEGRGWNGVSVVAWSPLVSLSSRGRRIRIERDGRVRTSTGDPLEAVRSLLGSLPRRDAGRHELGASLIGYLGYELGGTIERLPMTRRDELRAPDLHLVHYGAHLCYDHQARRWTLSVSGPVPWSARRRELEARLGEPSPPKARPGAGYPAPGDPAPGSNFERAAYLGAIRRAKRHIRDGDIYQVNLSQRLSATLREDPWELYLKLRRTNPAPYACYLKYPGITVAGSSPELFLRVTGGSVLTRPIKGTRPRGGTPAEDRRLERELVESAKDRAELSMIVDLERNDLGRVCAPGTVRVRRHARVERHPTVFHTVSDVVGRLAPGRDLVDLLRATFPGGSVTGCPKIRAMQIIDDLEPTTRGPYTGSMGYLTAGGDAVLNISIRTLLASRGKVSYQVGGAIVADSVPAEEYRETLVKGAAMARVLGWGEAIR